MDRILNSQASQQLADLSFTGKQAADQQIDLCNIELPALREDLEFVERDGHGSSTYAESTQHLVFDPTQNRYFNLTQMGLQCLAHWDCKNGQKLHDLLLAQYGYAISAKDLSDFIRFLAFNSLFRDLKEDVRGAHQPTGIKKAQKLFGQMIFIKFPLFRPDSFLRWTYPFVAPFFTKLFAILLVPMALLGLYLVSRQWDVFVSTFLHFISPSGFAIYGVSLIALKIFHELGHAWMARKYNVRVPVIGVALMIFMPIMYTDTTNAWRLRSARQRLMIDCAGIFIELAIAVFATLLWVFLPDGPLRSVAFVTATTSWILSVVINLNPLMRFDGYYILSDLLNVPNMQMRSFALARWSLREFLFGLGEPVPEQIDTSLRRGLTLLAFATWLYRLFLFLGIGLLVYAFFIKAIGVLLFVGAIFFLVALPIGHELKHWWTHRMKIMTSFRTIFTCFIFGGILILFFVPWNGSTSFPALLSAGKEARLHAPVAAQIIQISATSGQMVEKGDILFVLKLPAMASEQQQIEEQISLLKTRLNRMVADRQDREDRRIIEGQLATLVQELDGLNNMNSELQVKAPFSGILRDLDPDLSEGEWVNPELMLAVIVEPKSVSVTGFIEEDKLARLNDTARGQFIPDDPMIAPVPIEVASIARIGIDAVEEPYLASIYGGPIAVKENSDGEFKPVRANYEVRLNVNEDDVDQNIAARVVRGSVLADAQAESYFSSAKRQILKVLVRESGF